MPYVCVGMPGVDDVTDGSVDSYETNWTRSASCECTGCCGCQTSCGAGRCGGSCVKRSQNAGGMIRSGGAYSLRQTDHDEYEIVTE